MVVDLVEEDMGDAVVGVEDLEVGEEGSVVVGEGDIHGVQWAFRQEFTANCTMSPNQTFANFAVPSLCNSFQQNLILKGLTMQLILR